MVCVMIAAIQVEGPLRIITHIHEMLSDVVRDAVDPRRGDAHVQRECMALDRNFKLRLRSAGYDAFVPVFM